jgi:hypothetical protein
VKSEPLTDAEFERLSGILGRFDNKQPMNLEQLDGFLAALICGPRLCVLKCVPTKEQSALRNART